MSEKFFELTTPQKAIITMEQFHPGTSMNNIAGKITINEKVDFLQLKKAIQIFVKNTDNIRYQLHIDQDNVKQYKKDYEPFKIEHFVLNSINEEEICNSIARKPFDLFDMPLFKFATFQNEDLTGGFLLCVHHFLADAWAMGMLISSIISIYSKLIKKEKIEINNNLYQYTDFIKQEKEYLQSDKYKKDEDFWNNLFSENIFENTYLDTISSNLDLDASRTEFKLSKKITSKIVKFCKELKISPFTFLLYIMAIYESKVKQTNNIVLSTPILNRSGKKEKVTFGLFVNNMLYKLNIEENKSFYDSVISLNNSQFSYLRHQKYPLQELITNIKSKFQIKENIYNISVSYQNARTVHNNDNVQYTSKWLFNGYLTIPLVFHIYDMDDTSSFSFIYDYQNNLYNYSQIKDIHYRILYICNQVIENPNILIKDIELSTQEEKNKILNEFNNTKIKYDTKRNIIDLWEKQVKLFPSKTAIVCGEKEISYKELDEESNNLAGYLQKKYNVKPGRNISVILERSIDLVVATLAILKCGCSYVLIDTSHPKDRQMYMIENSNSQYVISDLDLKLENKINWNRDIRIDDKKNFKKVEIVSENPMYLLYTSGSTGLPKAVTVTHRNFHNYLIGISRIIDYDSENIVLSMASISFDVFGYELWVTLLKGLTLVLSTKEEQNDFAKINDLITKYEVNILYGTPSKIQSIMSSIKEYHNLKSLKSIGIGGETFNISFIKNIQSLTSAEIYNMYGPTETTIGCCAKKLDKNTKVITIGKPMANVKFYVLDKNLKLCPPGIKGELYISGDGVSKGYYQKEDLTSKNFIQDIFNSRLIMYKSGDMVSWTKDGEILFYGRTDNQIKIRGYRIELNEIEKVLSEHKFIKNCIVVNYKNNDRDFLCAYYISDFTIQNYELKLFLQNKLPNYMIPTYFIPISSLPLTVNGKVDKKALPSPFDLNVSEKYVKPENNLQKNICKILEKCLGIKKIGIEENFMNLGMDSLLVINVQSELSSLGIYVPTQYFYDYSTVKDLCFALENNIDSVDSSVINDNYPFLQHDLNKIKLINNSKLKNVLLTGATGFLGIHILENLLNMNIKVYCLIRGTNVEKAKKRLVSMLKFYFKDFNEEETFKKIEVIVGDIRYKNLGLSEEEIELLGQKVNLVIHSAATVKHLGRYEDFRKLNLEGTKNVAEFCMKYNIGLNHISTMSVSGDYMPLNSTNDNVDFTEENFFIGQNYQENYYIRSKLLAEEFLLQKIKEKNIKANIFRIGNLTGRYRDGQFQYNIDSNSFYNKLQFILKNQFFYESSNICEFDISPVDEISKAIVQIIYNYGHLNKIFHMTNPQKFTMKTLADKFNNLGYSIQILKDSDFYKKITKVGLNENSLVINDYNLYTAIPYLNIKTKSKITQKYLENIGFHYKRIDEKYLSKILEYCKNIKFI